MPAGLLLLGVPWSACWTASELGLSIWVCKRHKYQEKCDVWVLQASTRQRQRQQRHPVAQQAAGAGHVGGAAVLLRCFSHPSAAHRVSPYTLQTGCKPAWRVSRAEMKGELLARALQAALEPAAPAAVQQSNLAGPGEARAGRSSTGWECLRPPPPPPTNPLCSPRLCPPFPQAFLVAQRL